MAKVFAAFFSRFEFKDCAFKLLLDLKSIGFSHIGRGGEWLLVVVDVQVVDVDRSDMETDGCVIGCMVSLTFIWLSSVTWSFCSLFEDELFCWGKARSVGKLTTGWSLWLLFISILLPGFRRIRFRATCPSNGAQNRMLAIVWIPDIFSSRGQV